MDKIYTILFKDKDMQRAERLTPDGYTTTRIIRAAMIEGRQKADRIAAEIREDFPDAVVTVAPF